MRMSQLIDGKNETPQHLGLSTSWPRPVRGVLRDQSGGDGCGNRPAFCQRQQPFWRALHLAGFTPIQISPEHDETILQYGYGLTTAVAPPTGRRMN
jgi:hypothetical protein